MPFLLPIFICSQARLLFHSQICFHERVETNNIVCTAVTLHLKPSHYVKAGRCQHACTCINLQEVSFSFITKSTCKAWNYIVRHIKCHTESEIMFVSVEIWISNKFLSFKRLWGKLSSCYFKFTVVRKIVRESFLRVWWRKILMFFFCDVRSQICWKKSIWLDWFVPVQFRIVKMKGKVDAD